MSTTPCQLTPPLGARAQHMTASTIPQSLFGHVARLADTRGLRQPFVRPNHLAAPSRRRALWDVPPSLGPNRSPWYDGRAEIIPFRYLPVLLGGKGTSHVGWYTGDLPAARTILLFYLISERPSEQPLMVRTFRERDVVYWYLIQ